MRDFRLIPAIVMTVILALASGCGKSPGASGKELVAKIGNYEMTTEDFRYELRLGGHGAGFDADPEKAKATLLDEMITRKALVQEAARQGLDKEKLFMAEIERYWEQALLKELFSKKMKELASEVRVSDEEVKLRYDELVAAAEPGINSYARMSPELRKNIFNRKVQEALDAWMVELEKKSGVTVYKENLDKIEVRR